MKMLRALVTRPLLARPLRPLLARLPLAAAQSRMAKSSGFDLSRPIVGPRPKRPWKLHGFSMDVDFPAVKALLKDRDAARPEAQQTGDYSIVDELREQSCAGGKRGLFSTLASACSGHTASPQRAPGTTPPP